MCVHIFISSAVERPSRIVHSTAQRSTGGVWSTTSRVKYPTTYSNFLFSIFPACYFYFYLRPYTSHSKPCQNFHMLHVPVCAFLPPSSLPRARFFSHPIIPITAGTWSTVPYRSSLDFLFFFTCVRYYASLAPPTFPRSASHRLRDDWW